MNDDRLTHLSFREDLMYALTKQRRDELKVSAESAALQGGASLAKDHYIDHSDKKGDCAYCSDRSTQRVQTHYFCVGCSKHLCIGDCFKLYHA